MRARAPDFFRFGHDLVTGKSQIDDLPRGDHLNNEFVLCEQRQTVEGRLPGLQGYAEASLHFVDDSTAFDSRATSFMNPSHFCALPCAFPWKELKTKAGPPNEKV